MKTALREIYQRAGAIAGCLWDDRVAVGGLGDQIRQIAATPSLGSDGDLTDDDRSALQMLADEADEVNRLIADGVCPTCRGDDSLACPDFRFHVSQ